MGVHSATAEHSMVSMGSPAGPCALCHCVMRGEDAPVPAAGCLCGSDVTSHPLALLACGGAVLGTWRDSPSPEVGVLQAHIPAMENQPSDGQVL